MKIKFFCPRWGAESIAWEPFLQAVKKAGYDGIEWFPYAEKEDYIQVVKLLEQYGLEYTIVMAVIHHIDGVDNYLAELERQLIDLSAVCTEHTRPLAITAQTGREFYSEEEAARCIACCEAVSRKTGIPVYQETHRNKWAFAAHAVYKQLLKNPDTPLTLDVSHWFCVSESYLHDQQPAVELAIRSARHIHARVGHCEGPQVWDPAAEEYSEALAEHLKIWDKWIQLRRESGAAYCTITPEFGPPPYLVFANRAGTPFEEQWRLNLWMKDLLQKRYENS
ncbi:MAG: sugar phosphate isomerase/epimerase [Williamsia sp.]|nr:sugar phosphate isomerase/epimerase [Williamsia sp.]